MAKALEIFFVFNYTFDFSNFIDLLGIIVNSALAFWIVRTIQNKLTNKRVLKDHFISEIKEIRSEYNEYIKNIYNGSVVPQEALRWFKLQNIKKIHLMEDVTNIYKISSPQLTTFHTDLRELVTNSPEFSNNYRSNLPVSFSTATKRELDRIQLTYNGIFNKLIIKVNDSN